ncbi:hypothetical protein CTI14_42460 [Methylobacterium radiotolerans]|nr:hypothetical protein CTI14_42460 [Methylobacterium radiotolerans]
MTDQGAAAIEAMLASVPSYTGSANASIVSLIAMMASSEDEAKQMASALTGALRDPPACWRSRAGTIAAAGNMDRRPGRRAGARLRERHPDAPGLHAGADQGPGA